MKNQSTRRMNVLESLACTVMLNGALSNAFSEEDICGIGYTDSLKVMTESHLGNI